MLQVYWYRAPCKRPQTVPACYDSGRNCSALPWIFLDLGRLCTVLEPLIQGRSAWNSKFNVIHQRSRSYHRSSSWLDVEIGHKHNQLVIRHGEGQELKQETTAIPTCYVPVCLKKKHNARKAVWFTTATMIGAISAFVDSIDSHIILRMIRESKMTELFKTSTFPLSEILPDTFSNFVALVTAQNVTTWYDL